MSKVLRYVSKQRPSPHDSAPYATQIEVIIDPGVSVLYIQTSDNPQKPHWERASIILERVYEEKLKNYEFVDALLTCFHEKKEFPDLLKFID